MDILFLAHRVPYPPDRGDKVRSYNVLKHLSAKHRVHLVAFADDPADLGHDAALAKLAASHVVIRRTRSRVAAVVDALIRGRPVSLSAFDSAVMSAAVGDALNKRAINAIYVYSGQMAQYLPATTRARVVMDFVDVDSAKFAAYADQAGGPMRWLYAREAGLLGAFERKVAARADATLFVSEAEAALFRSGCDAVRVQAVGNGIDADAFSPDVEVERPAINGRLVVFTGQMDYPPNIAAVAWFARSVLPAIRSQAGEDVRFAIVGRTPTAAVRALGDLPGVIVTGTVPDVRGWLAAAGVVVAPLNLARGIQNKVLEAMAMARPVVASPAAAEGIEHDGTIHVADGADAFAQAVAALLNDPTAGWALGAAARRQVLARYGWAARLRPLDALLDAGTSVRDAA